MRAHCWMFVLVALGLSGVSRGQQAQPVNPQTPLPTITKQTSLVLVDSVVTDKQGNYIRDLTQKDFRVFEDGKEQSIKSFSFESETAGAPDHKHYMVMFFDDSTMNVSDQTNARNAAMKFLDTNTGPNRYIAIVDFGGSLRITQNFTADAERLKAVVKTLKFSAVSPLPETASLQPTTSPLMGIPQLTGEADFAVRTLLLALRNLAKGVSNVPGRKTLVLFSSGFPMDAEHESELMAAIDACNKANVAVYPIDVRGLITPMGKASPPRIFPESDAKLVSATFNPAAANDNDNPPAHLVYVQRGGGTGGGGHTGGAGTGGAGRGVSGGTTGTRGAPGGAPATVANPMPVNPYSTARGLLPPITESSANQTVLYQLAMGTGGFVIVNTNDLLGGLQKIAREQNEYYVLGYTPPASDEGSCHTLKVKVDRGGTIVRSRTGYCNIKPSDALAGKPIEKQLENQANGSQPGNVTASMRAPYFFTSPNTARVNLAIDIPSGAIKFEKEKGKEHAEINVLAMAYLPDGTVAARFSDNVEFNFDDKEQVKEFTRKPYLYQNQFEIASGHYTLKVAFSSGGESFGKLEMPLLVDTYDAKQFSISSVALSKELHPVNQASASLDAALLEDRTPLVAQGMEIVPSGDAQFKPSDMAVFYAELYDPRLAGTDPPKVGVQFLVIDLKTKEKKMQTGGPVPDPKPGSPVVPFGLRLPVDKLAPGSYELQVRGTDSTGEATPVRVADFQVQ